MLGGLRTPSSKGRPIGLGNVTLGCVPVSYPVTSPPLGGQAPVSAGAAQGIDGRVVVRFAAMAALLLAASGVAVVLGEHIPLNNGFGFEAFTVYKPITQNLPEHFRGRKIDAYSIQRILPFVTAHFGLRALGLPLKGRNIRSFFAAYNLTLLLVAVWLWLRIARDHGLSARGAWLGFIGLFANFAVLKLTFYYPVNIDTTALLLGVATLHFYGRQATWKLLLVCMAGLLIWPTTLLVGTVLLCLPASTGSGDPDGSARNQGLILALISGLILAVLAVFGYAHYVVGVRAPSGGAEAVHSLMPLSLAVVAVYLFLVLRPLLAGVEIAKGGDAIRSALSGSRLTAVVVLWAGYLFLTRVLANPGPPRLSTWNYLVHYVSLGATARPAQFLIAHVTYCGALCLVLILLWPRVASCARRLGWGLAMVVAFAVVLGVNSETRQLINVWPFLVLPGVLVVERLHLPLRFHGTLAVFALLLSKIWFPINYAVSSLGEAGRAFPRGAGSYLDFPAQAYFMNFGPWMSNLTLAIQGLTVAGMGVWLHRRYLAPSIPLGDPSPGRPRT